MRLENNGVNSQVFDWDMRTLRLPKLVEADPRAPELHRILPAHARLLWPEGKIHVPTVAFSPAVAEALLAAHRAFQLVRSLEGAERRLAAEDRGLSLVDQQSGVLRGARVSRLLVLADDGTERFYRQVEKLLREEGTSRQEIGRDEFLRRTWDWKEKYGSHITRLSDENTW